MHDTDNGSIYEFGGFRLLPGQRQLLAENGEAVALRAKAFELLLYLVRRRGRVVDKAELMQALWPNAIVEDNNLSQAISALRQALGETARSPRFIATITGRGYQFVADVRVREPDDVGPTPNASRPQRGRLAIVVVALIGIAAVILLWPRPADTPPGTGIAVIDRFAQLTPILVTDFHGSHSEPTFSPDGTMIAWTSDISDTAHVWVKNLQSGDPIQLTDGSYAASSPTWSPDNSYIVYARSGPDGGIYRVGTLGTPGPRRIVDVGGEPSFSLGTNAFVFSRGQSIFIASGNGKNVRRIETVPQGPGFARRSPALSPDGSLVAFVHADAGPIGNLWIAPTGAGKARQLTSFTIEDGFIVESPAWAPDGRHIVYSIASRTGGSRLWQLSIDSLEAAPLTAGAGYADHPVVSADGERLAYSDMRSSWKIIRVNPDTGDRKTIFESRNMSVLPMASPDGREIVFFSALRSGAQLFTIGTDGRGLAQLTFDEDGTNTLPFWSSDGRSIFYYRDRSLHRLHLGELRDEKVYADFHWSSRNWPAAHGDRLFFSEFDNDRTVHRGVIRNLRTDTEVELPVGLRGGEWSASGEELLGFVPSEGIYICEVESLECRLVRNAGEPVRGLRPKWSRDEQRIFYLRSSGTGECCTLWAVNRDGTGNRELIDLPGYDFRNSYFGVDHEGMIFYNRPDNDASEIWLVLVE